MKLRVRSIESKQTHRIEVPNSCNLQQLKETIATYLSSSSSSSSANSCNLVLSLNRKDELCGSSSEESVQSIGITSGDLIYFSEKPFAFSSENLNFSNAQIEKPSELVNPNSEFSELGVGSDNTRDFVDTKMENSLNLTNCDDKNRDMLNPLEFECGKTVGSIDTHMGRSSESINGTDQSGDVGDFRDLDTPEKGKLSKDTDVGVEMEVDDDASVLNSKAIFSVPSFLKKVFVKEVGDVANGGDHKLLVIGVHAVLLESGFVCYDPISKTNVDGFHLNEEWPSSAFGITLHYTLPKASSSELVETIVLKFQTLGKFVNVYGTLSSKGFGVHRVSLDEPRFIQALSFVWKMNDDTNSKKEGDASMKLYPNREIFKFWKIVKDGLSYPLLIELCEKLGLVPPPCFMRLPTELKLKILESLCSVDVARVCCVCSELNFVASNNDLWRLKYEDEFEKPTRCEEDCEWKAEFSVAWEFRMRAKRVRLHCPYPFREAFSYRPSFPGQRDSNPFGLPYVIGGDFDRLPPHGVPYHLPSLGVPRHRGQRSFQLNFRPLGH